MSLDQARASLLELAAQLVAVTTSSDGTQQKSREPGWASFTAHLSDSVLDSAFGADIHGRRFLQHFASLLRAVTACWLCIGCSLTLKQRRIHHRSSAVLLHSRPERLGAVRRASVKLGHVHQNRVSVDACGEPIQRLERGVGPLDASLLESPPEAVPNRLQGLLLGDRERGSRTQR